MRLSIVVPFYNTDFIYFDNMIESLFRQTYKKFELIIVDDGSIAYATEKLNNYNFGDLNVQIIHQDNKGLPGARNTGIKNAIGDYIVFVDSDDMLPQNALQEAINYITEYNEPDVIFGKMVYFTYNEGSPLRITNDNCRKEDLDSYLMSLKQNNTDIQFYQNEDIDKVKIKLLHQDSKSIILGSSSANVYKRSVLLQCTFDENVRICEDQIFNRNILNNITNCLLVPNEWYYYIQYRSSMLHNQSKNIDLMKTFSYWDKIREIDRIETPEIKHFSNIHNIGLICDEIKKMALTGRKYDECRIKIQKLYEHPIIQDALNDNEVTNSSINKIKLFLFRHKLLKLLFVLYAKK